MAEKAIVSEPGLLPCQVGQQGLLFRHQWPEGGLPALSGGAHRHDVQGTRRYEQLNPAPGTDLQALQQA